MGKLSLASLAALIYRWGAPSSMDPRVVFSSPSRAKAPNRYVDGPSETILSLTDIHRWRSRAITRCRWRSLLLDLRRSTFWNPSRPRMRTSHLTTEYPNYWVSRGIRHEWIAKPSTAVWQEAMVAPTSGCPLEPGTRRRSGWVGCSSWCTPYWTTSSIPW